MKKIAFFVLIIVMVGAINACVSKKSSIAYSKNICLKNICASKKTHIPCLDTIFVFSVDYSRPLKDMVEEHNHKNGINAEQWKLFIDSNETIGKEIKVSAKLFNYESSWYDVNTESVLSNMDAAGYRPANIFELLAFSGAMPKIPDNVYTDYCNATNIVALGSVWQGIVVPLLAFNGKDVREAPEHYFSDGLFVRQNNFFWGGYNTYFLAIKK